MALEQTIADLVSAANNLTSTVNGKMGEIDEKVDEAVSSVPDTIRGLSSTSYCIDAVTGDDSGDGSSSSPFKTFAPLRDLIVSGSYTRIHLREGQDHLHEDRRSQ